jgi:hypothetical protein
VTEISVLRGISRQIAALAFFFDSDTKDQNSGTGEIFCLQARPDTRKRFRYTKKLGAVPKWPKGEVCKTSIRGFESHPRLQSEITYDYAISKTAYSAGWPSR